MGQPHPLLNEMRNLFKDDSVSMKILTASREERLEFLAGCLDTDGYLFNNCFEIVQKRKKFADAISFVARSLGFKVTTSEKFVDDKKYFRMFISGETSLIPTRIERKQASKRRQIKNACHTGFKVEKIEDGQYCGFTLNGDGRFLLGDFTVTHNTECAKALAEFLFDDDQAIVRVDMSEYMEKHAVSRLVGSPPGYVGYDEGGQLTEAVRHRPYCLVLLDEVEKAHPDVWNIMLQVFDEGRLTDTQGRTVDFTNTIILMTSNIGSDLYYQDHDDQTLAVLRDKLLQSKFRPEFLNRIDETIYFHPLYKEHMINILDIQLQSVQKRLKEKELSLTLSKEAREWLAENGYDPKFGARPLKRLIKKEILKPLSDHMLTTEIKPGSEIKMALEGDRLKVVTTTKSKRQ